MSGSAQTPVRLLIAALGGEGGGVLAGWIDDAACAEGLAVQGTSIPGVAQRTGATTYYIEIWPEPLRSGKRPVLSLSPVPGEVDVVCATELLEAGRCIAGGFITPDRTHLITSVSRVYTTHEKMAPGDGRFDPKLLLDAVERRAHAHTLLDLDAVAAESRSRINAVLLGAIAGLGVLPIPARSFVDAIRAGDKAVDANIRGFEAGLAAAGAGAAASAQQAAIPDLIELARARVAAYQDRAYGDLYLARLAPFGDGNPGLLADVVRHLARRMTYEDIIRVAQLKTRPGRMAHIRAEMKGPVQVSEYFRPGLTEVSDILPPVLARVLMRRAEGRAPRETWFRPVTLRSSTVMGFLALKTLAALRPLRRISFRFGIEQAAIDAWLDDVSKAQAISPALGREAARSARLIKGYGSTHKRGLAHFNHIRRAILKPALDGGTDAARPLAEACDAALSDRQEQEPSIS